MSLDQVVNADAVEALSQQEDDEEEEVFFQDIEMLQNHGIVSTRYFTYNKKKHIEPSDKPGNHPLINMLLIFFSII